MSILGKRNQFVRILEQLFLLLPFLSMLLYIIIRLASSAWWVLLKLCAKLITDLFCRNKFSRKSFKMSVKDIVTMNRKHMQHTTVSHDLELITSMETEEVTDTTYVSKRFDSNRGLSDSKPTLGGFP